MIQLFSIGEAIAKAQSAGLESDCPCEESRVARSTLDALENTRLGELGYSKVTNILTALGLELRLQDATARRPTFEDLMNEGQDDQGLDRRR